MNHDHLLEGCQPEPLASYLKALAVLRLVCEQADKAARGFWTERGFVLRTVLSKDDLVRFFVHDYAPTPMVTPWAGSSGFYEGDDMTGINAISSSNDVRFSAFRDTIEMIRSWPQMETRFETVADITTQLVSLIQEKQPGKDRDKVEKLHESILDSMKRTSHDLNSSLDAIVVLKDKASKELMKALKKGRTECNKAQRSEIKEDLVSICRMNFSDSTLAWLDSALSTMSQYNKGKGYIEDKISYNPILGSGGNDGRLIFSKILMSCLGHLLISSNPEERSNLLESSLWGTVTKNLILEKIGQFDPGRSGGFNQGMEVETENFKINTWDFVLSMEGSLITSCAIYKSNDADSTSFSAFPFVVTNSMTGYSSSSEKEESRKELWLPLWGKPASYQEIRHLFAEGRNALGRRKAQTGLDFSRAISSLGVDRGFSAFQRFSFLLRKGKSYIALPAGRIPVRYNPRVHLLDDLDPILSKVDFFLRQFKTLPASLASARRNIDQAIYDAAVKGDTGSFVSLVRALGNLEALLAARDHQKDPNWFKPLSGLRPEWITACGTATEVHLAAALASIHAMQNVGGIRANLAGTDPTKPWTWAQGKAQKNWYGPTFVERLGGVLAQRLMDAARLNGEPIPPLEAWYPVSPHLVTAFLLGETDDALLEDLLWAFTWVRWTDKENDNAALRELRKNRPLPPEPRAPLVRPYALAKLLYHPEPIRKQTPRLEPRLLPLLQAGRTDEALELAVRRLRIHGLRPFPVEGNAAGILPWVDAKRLAAALLIPVTGTNELEGLVLQPNET